MQTTISNRKIDMRSKKEVLSSIGQFIETIYGNLDRKVDYDWKKLSGVVGAYLIDTYQSFSGKQQEPSPFKQSANLLLNFAVEKPIATPMYAENTNIGGIENHQNIIIPLTFGIEFLHGARIRNKSGEVSLSNRISLSEHSLIDLIRAIGESTPSAHFKLTAILFEQMAYRFNHNASDHAVISSSLPFVLLAVCSSMIDPSADRTPLPLSRA